MKFVVKFWSQTDHDSGFQSKLARLATDWEQSDQFWSLSSLQQTLSELDTLFWTTEDSVSDAWLGCVVVKSLKIEGELLYIHTLSHVRGMGIGSTLFAEVKRQLKANHAFSTLYLEVRPSNLAAIKLYKSQGFVETGRRARYYQDGEDALTMALDL